ncbi:unnamed protein product [Closterium sp. NIES-65]|nr:unnamed protein product [Closterium sp. NIES-65]CAI5989129.1 unnamed protein product [Closterium sp. NIES-65]
MERICYIGGCATLPSPPLLHLFPHLLCSTSSLTSSAPPLPSPPLLHLFPHLLCSALLSPPLVPFPPPDGQQATGNNHGQQATRSDRIGARAKPFPPLLSPLLPDGQQATGSDRIGARAGKAQVVARQTQAEQVAVGAMTLLLPPFFPDFLLSPLPSPLSPLPSLLQMGSKPRGAIVSAHVLARLRSWRGRHKQSESRWGQALVKVKAQAPGEGDAE